MGKKTATCISLGSENRTLQESITKKKTDTNYVNAAADIYVLHIFTNIIITMMI
jgi:hypothetical protein